MFNFIAASFLNYMLVNFLRPPRDRKIRPRHAFPIQHRCPKLHEILGLFGIPFSKVPSGEHLSFDCRGTLRAVWWLLMAHAVGLSDPGPLANPNPQHNMPASAPRGITINRHAHFRRFGRPDGPWNNVMGEQERLVLNAVGGRGLHRPLPWRLWAATTRFGVFLAALLFGFLYQGGAELAPVDGAIPRELIVVIQALVHPVHRSAGQYGAGCRLQSFFSLREGRLMGIWQPLRRCSTAP